MENLNGFIEESIVNFIASCGKVTKYRTPLVGFASAQDERFVLLKNVAGQGHITPYDILPTAKSVVSFFIPFTKELLYENSVGEFPVLAWGTAYDETNILIGEVVAHLSELLLQKGYKCGENQAKFSFDKERLVHRWSVRHIANICGLGTFGINNMLISKSGCGGRYGSFVTEAPVVASPKIEGEYCLYKRDKSCKLCVNRCPVQALDPDKGFARKACHERLLQNGKSIFGTTTLEICGKCITGPCVLKNP